MNEPTLDSYFWHIANKSGKKLVLPFPNANPKFGNEGESLANRKASHEFAGKVLDWNRKRLGVSKD